MEGEMRRYPRLSKDSKKRHLDALSHAHANGYLRPLVPAIVPSPVDPDHDGDTDYGPSGPWCPAAMPSGGSASPSP